MRCSQHGSIPTHQDKKTHTRTHTLMHRDQISARKGLFQGRENGRLAGARGSQRPGGFLWGVQGVSGAAGLRARQHQRTSEHCPTAAATGMSAASGNAQALIDKIQPFYSHIMSLTTLKGELRQFYTLQIVFTGLGEHCLWICGPRGSCM